MNRFKIRNLQLAVIGALSVGKTSIIDRYVKNKFNYDRANTIGVDFAKTCYTTASGEKLQVKIWDTCGLERARALTNQFIKRADGVIIAFSLDDRRSFESVL